MKEHAASTFGTWHLLAYVRCGDRDWSDYDDLAPLGEKVLFYNNSGDGSIGTFDAGGDYHEETASLLSKSDSAWAPADGGTPNTAQTQKWTVYPELGPIDAGDAGLIRGNRVSTVPGGVAIAFLGSRLLVVGRTPEETDKGISLLFSETGQANPKALAA